jgi:hypothetical protein
VNSQVTHIVGCVFVSVAVRQAADSEMLLPRLSYYTSNDTFFMSTMFTFTLMVQLYVVAFKHGGFVETLGTNSSDSEAGSTAKAGMSGAFEHMLLLFRDGNVKEGDFMKFLQASVQILWISYNAYVCIFSKGFHFVWRFDSAVWFLIERSKHMNGLSQSEGAKKGAAHQVVGRVAQALRILAVFCMMLMRICVFLVCIMACSLSMSPLLPPDTLWYNDVSEAGRWCGLVLLGCIIFSIVFIEVVALGCCDIIVFVSRQCFQLVQTKNDGQELQLRLAFGVETKQKDSLTDLLVKGEGRARAGGWGKRKPARRSQRPKDRNAAANENEALASVDPASVFDALGAVSRRAAPKTARSKTCV